MIKPESVARHTSMGNLRKRQKFVIINGISFAPATLFCDALGFIIINIFFDTTMTRFLPPL